VLGWDDAEALVVGAYFDVLGNLLVALLISMTQPLLRTQHSPQANEFPRRQILECPKPA